jgi:hypothetical protein
MFKYWYNFKTLYSFNKVWTTEITNQYQSHVLLCVWWINEYTATQPYVRHILLQRSEVSKLSLVVNQGIKDWNSKVNNDNPVEQSHSYF